MRTIHDQILERLGETPDDVKELASRALELCGEQSEASAVEQLRALVRKLVREGAADDSQ